MFGSPSFIPVSPVTSAAVAPFIPEVLLGEYSIDGAVAINAAAIDMTQFNSVRVRFRGSSPLPTQGGDVATLSFRNGDSAGVIVGNGTGIYGGFQWQANVSNFMATNQSVGAADVRLDGEFRLNAGTLAGLTTLFAGGGGYAAQIMSWAASAPVTAPTRIVFVLTAPRLGWTGRMQITGVPIR